MPWGRHGEWWITGFALVFWLLVAGLAQWLIARATRRERWEPRGEGAGDPAATVCVGRDRWRRVRAMLEVLNRR
jgi:hypothetical protein